MGTYEWIVTISFALLAAVLAWRGGWYLLTDREASDEEESIARKRGGVLLAVGLMCLLVSLYVVTRQPMFITVVLVAGIGATFYTTGLGLWAHIQKH